MNRYSNVNHLIFIVFFAASTASSCGDDGVTREQVLVGGADVSGDDTGVDELLGPGPSVECTGEDYPCGPYGHLPCELITDHRFVPANDAARALAGEDGLLDMHDLVADESVTGILLYGTAGWCSACAAESRVLNDMYADNQPIPGTEGRAEFVAVVFEDGNYEPASLAYATRYADQYDFDFPVVADPRGDILYYFDAASTPGNIFIDATTMTIFYVAQGFMDSSMRATLGELDGSVACHRD